MKTVIILGSSNSDGNTSSIAQQISNLTQWDIIDLNQYNFSYYDYDHKNKDDDYLPLMKRIIENYDILVFATPVYWYSMSGIMKVFIDRITDLMDFEKDLGRKLRGKSMAAFSISYSNQLDNGFWLPFRESAKFLGMKYLGNAHFVNNENNEDKINEFIEKM